MVDDDGVIHYSPNVPGVLNAGTGLVDEVGSRPSSTTTPTCGGGELTHGRPADTEVLLVTLGTGVGGGIVTTAKVLRVRTASVPRSATSGRPRRTALRAASAATGKPSRRGRHSERGPARGRPGRLGVLAGGGDAAASRDARGRRRPADDPAGRPCSPSTPPTSPRPRRSGEHPRSRAHRRVRRADPSSTTCCRSGARCARRPLEKAPYRPEVPIVAAERVPTPGSSVPRCWRSRT